jgi:hypothetical protein
MGRKEEFLRIREEYDEFYAGLMREGKLPMGETGAGFWGTAITDDIFELFEALHLEKRVSFVDLGSGDGKVVMIASLFTKASGIEFDDDLVKKSIGIRDRLGLKAEIIKGDFLKQDLSKYDVIFINPDKQMRELEDKLLKEMRGVLVVYNIIYQPERLEKGKTYWSSNNVPSIAYTAPKKS